MVHTSITGDMQTKRKKISPETVAKHQLNWKFYAGGDISVTPAIFNDAIYFPSWNGNLYAVKASDGSLVWKKNMQKLTGFNNTGFVLNVNSTVSRLTPTIAGDLLLVGLFGPAIVIAVKRSNGNLMWSTRLDDHARGFITMSGTYYKEFVLIFTLILFLIFCFQFIGRVSPLRIRKQEDRKFVFSELGLAQKQIGKVASSFSDVFHILITVWPGAT
ncbi:hypothetical protein Q3G72_018983 [Acer saccharum]|nr:hypothetical protein Q3G72_018983 [Acer saccharum]